MQTELKPIKPTGNTTTAFVVMRDDITYGVIEKIRNTKDTIHPWKAFKLGGEYLGAFYDNGEDLESPDFKNVARDAAVTAVLLSWRKLV